MEKVIKTYAKRPVHPNHNLLCCRACLATDGKLYNMHEYNLVDAFTRISGITVKTDKLPQHLCSWCVMLLRRCNEFRAKCDRAKLCLLTTLMTGNVSMDYIRSIDRIANRLVDLQTTQVKTVQYPDVTQLENVTEEQIINMDNEECPPNIDVTNTENNKGKYLIKLSDLNTDYESENDEENVFIVKDIEEIKNKKLDDEIKVNRPVRKISRPRKKKIANVQTFDEAGKKISRWKRKKKPKKRQRTAENDYLPLIDFEKFQSTYRVKLVIMTEEEQLQEMDMRKASPKYLEAEYRCSDCAKAFRTESAYNNHRAKHDPSIGGHSCPVCALRFRSQSQREKHRDRHRLKFVCRECGFVLRTMYVFTGRRSNVRYHHDMHANRTTQCHHCGMVFRNHSTRQNHQRLAHADLNVACNVCGETFVGRRGLLNHKSITHNIKKREPKCGVCSASFISLEAMATHTHDGEHAGHACRLCGHTCASADTLRAHAADHHPTCDECRVTFVDARAFETHARRKHAPRRLRARGPYVCAHCGKTVPSMAALELHVRHHTGDKPYACSSCGRRFSNKNNMEMHMRTHTGERPYRCDHCALAFALKNNLQRHILVVHMGITTRAPCNICGRSLSTPSMLKVHVRKVHGGEPWPKRDPATRKVIKNVPDDN